jgi:hypothetical protein
MSIRKDVISNDTSAYVAGATLGIISVMFPWAPNSGEGVPAFNQGYAEWRMASAFATSIVGGIETIRSIPAPPSPPGAVAPASAGAGIKASVPAETGTTIEMPNLFAMASSVAGNKGSPSSSGSVNKRPRTATEKQPRSYNKSFMDLMLHRILSDTNHPLRFLIDETTKNWQSRQKYSLSPTVQAGHLKSLWGLAKREIQTLAIEDSTFNQWTSNVAETGRKAIVEKGAYLIRDVFVEARTAKMYERLGMLGEYKLGELTPGWTPTNPGLSKLKLRLLP